MDIEHVTRAMVGDIDNAEQHMISVLKLFLNVSFHIERLCYDINRQANPLSRQGVTSTLSPSSNRWQPWIESGDTCSRLG